MLKQANNFPVQGLKLGGFIFTPKLIPTLAALLVLVVLMNLGFWQLQRADEKSYLQSRLETRSQLQAMTLETVLNTPGDINDYPLQLTGYFDNRYNLLLDNQIHQRQAGYHLLTLFFPSNTKQALWVNRGWLATGRDRSILPPISAVNGPQSLQGRVYIPPEKVFLLKKDDFSQVSWPLRVQSVDLNALEDVLGVQLLPFTLRLNPESNGSGFPREWHHNPMGADKHKAYALQWFAMGFALVLIYIVTNTHKISASKPNNNKA